MLYMYNLLKVVSNSILLYNDYVLKLYTVYMWSRFRLVITINYNLHLNNLLITVY